MEAPHSSHKKKGDDSPPILKTKDALRQSPHEKKRDDSPPILKTKDALRQSPHEKKRDDSPLIHETETEDALRMRLWRTRDFLSLILSYPMKTLDDKRILEQWITQATSAGRQKYISRSGGLSTPDMKHILSTSPLKHLEFLIPSDVITEIEQGRRFLFKDHAAATSQGKSEQQQLTSSTSNTREGKQVLQLNVVDAPVIPQSILNLATDLAVNQLMHYFSGYSSERVSHKVRLSTRNVDEMLAVKGKIEGALKEVGRTEVIWIDASKYQVDKEATVTQEIAKELSTKTNLAQRHQFFTTERERMREFERATAYTRLGMPHLGMPHYVPLSPSGVWRRLHVINKNSLVIVVDGNGENKLRLGQVHLPQSERRSETDLVLLTTESATDEDNESRMELDLEIRIEDHLLPWLLFSRNVGSELLRDIQNIAVQIVEECRGHLLAIVLVAKSLKNVTDVERWKLALEKLRCTNNPDSVDNKPIIDNAFRNIVWEDLNILQKRCLKHYLFLSDAKGKAPVTILRSKWVDRGLVHTPEEAEHILLQLLDRSILLKLEGADVQIPVETHQILQSLTEFDQIPGIHGIHGRCQLDFTDSVLWEELPWEIGDLEPLQKLVIVRTSITKLPQFPDWPNLQELHLEDNAGLTEIPSSFFEKMRELRILNMSDTSISGLPSSFSYLENLRELYMRGCELFMELPPEIKQLKALEKLDLDKTQITHLPREIQELTNLQSLTLCFYGYDQSTSPIIPPGVISKLTNLSELNIDVNPDDNRWDENIEVILREISELRRLKTLTLYIPRADFKHLVDPGSIDFRYMIGDHKKRLISREPLAVTEKFKESGYKLRFVNGEDIPNVINRILRCTKAFFLDRHMSIKSLSEFDGSVLTLRTCIVGECNEMETLVDGIPPNKNFLLYVEFLSVYYMKNLESIWRGPAPSIRCFYHLTYIAFHTCPKLTTIFTLDFLDVLSMLEDLVVEDCSRLTTLISHESSNVQEKPFLPSLKRLILVYLPELVSISSGLLIGKGIEKIGFYYCPKLQSLSQQELSGQKLKIIKGETEWWEELNWNQWGQAGRPNKFNNVFHPINEEDDIMSQLIAEMRSEN